MSARRPDTRALDKLVMLRENEVERLSADMASREAVRSRYRESLARLDRLHGQLGASGQHSPALSLNCGAYKQAVMHLADTHRADLALHEADMAVAQRALTAAALRQEVLTQLRSRRIEHAQRQQDVRERKVHDELATQMWHRGRR